MQELYEKLLDEIRGAWRFRWIAMITAWAIALLGWALVLVMPDTYQATASVFVDTRTMLSQATQGIAVDTNIDTQIQRVRQAMLGGPEIEKVAREEFPEFATSTAERRQLLVSKLRDRITITGSATRESPTAGKYVITYTDENRTRSEQIVRRLVTSFVEGSRGGNREDTENTRRFLDDQIAKTTGDLRAAEATRRDFQTKNFALMLGTQGDYFARQQAETTELEKDKSSLAVKISQREALRRQLAIESPALNGTTDPSVSGLTSPGVAPGNDTASRIRATEAELDSLLLQFTDKHPRVIALRATLEDLKARQQAEMEAVKRGDPGAASRFGLESNPVYLDLQKQLNVTEVEIAVLQRSVADHQNKIAELNKVMTTAPEIEAELKYLNRDYDQKQRLYNDHVDRRSRMNLSEQAEDTGKKSTFEVTDPATASYIPVAPNRPRLIVVVLFAALAAGGGLAYLLCQLKPIFSSPRQLSEVTGLPVLGLVNMIWLGRYQAAARRGAIAYVALAALLVGAAGVMFVVQSEATRIVRTLIS